ncbi:MAG: hypothetical protein KA715_12630 [Xanthomonadaceae bacterium]|nr:hypothetical protein [Xanthomonadaceae bacterium]
MMKNLLALVTILFSQSSFAHIEPGIYVGETPTGGECSIESVRQYYVDDVRHPLNERIELKMKDGTKFTVGHPPIIDTEEKYEYTGYNHDLFQGVLPTKVGADALSINMDHPEGKEGRPVAFHFLSHNWKEKKIKVLHCENLEAAD